MEKIKVILCKVGEEAEVIEIEDTLETMQELVGGMIEEYQPFEDAAIICNDEGKIQGLPLNRAIYGEDGKIIDVIAGDFFICYAPIESERPLSLPDDLEKKYMEYFKSPEHICMSREGIVAIKYTPTK